MYTIVEYTNMLFGMRMNASDLSVKSQMLKKEVQNLLASQMETHRKPRSGTNYVDMDELGMCLFCSKEVRKEENSRMCTTCRSSTEAQQNFYRIAPSSMEGGRRKTKKH